MQTKGGISSKQYYYLLLKEKPSVYTKMWFPISESQFKNFHATYFIFYENVITILSARLRA
jgi:hypothetical protein